MPLPVLIMRLHRALNYELTFLRNARYIAICCVCLKSKTLCIYRFSPSSSPRLLQNIGEFRGKKKLQTIPGLIILYLIQYTLSEIHFWSVKCITVTLRKNLEQHPSHSSDAGDYNELMKTNHFKKLLNAFNTTHTCSNCIVYWLFYCWQIT